MCFVCPLILIMSTWLVQLQALNSLSQIDSGIALKPRDVIRSRRGIVNSILECFVAVCKSLSTASPPPHPEKGPIHKSPANEFMNPTRAPDLLWIWPPSLEKKKQTNPQ